MKRFILLSLTCLLVIALVLPACAAPPEPENVIRIGIIGPMTFPQGEAQWRGAMMGRDEVNAAGGVTIGGEQYFIELVQAESNEIFSPADAATAMERLITVDKVDSVFGGFRTEATFPMQEVAMDYKTLFTLYGASTMALCKQVADDYDRYKYTFRGTPFNEYFLVNNDFMLIGMVADRLRKELNIRGNLKVAIIAEKLEWTEAMVAIATAKLPAMGMDVVGAWRPSDTATDVNAALTAIAAEEPHIIFTIFSGPVGITYAKTWGELEIPACSVGINVEGQKSGFMEATGGKGMYDCFLGAYMRGVAITEKTIPFVESYVEKYGVLPIYTAATYDGIINSAKHVEEAQSLDPDDLIPVIEKTDRITTGGRVTFYPNDSECPKCPHDLVYGPGYVTGTAVQWQDSDPISGLKCVWPADWEGMPEDWRGLHYEGTVDYVIPPRVVDKFWVEPTEKPAPPEEEAAPAEGEFSFEAAEYKNADYGFSVKYPKSWAEQPVSGETSTVFYAAAVAKVPAITVAVEDSATFADALTAALEAGGGSGINIDSETETTLADGTPATEAVLKYTPEGSPIPADCFSLGVQKDDKWVIVTVITVSLLYSYDEALFSEIAHTLEFE